jgi:hypothetical protein
MVLRLKGTKKSKKAKLAWASLEVAIIPFHEQKSINFQETPLLLL